MKLCFIVHRYAPFPGGSEYYVQQMAEECVNRGHDVTVIAAEHKGDLNGVKVTNSGQRVFEKYDLMIVHGGDVSVQNQILMNAKTIPSPILYLLIKPSESSVCLQALNDVKYIGCSTLEDWKHTEKWFVQEKSRKVTHGISPKDCTGVKGVFKKKYNIPEDKQMFLSCGGYWHNKKMIELANTFQKANLKDAILVTTGYDNRSNLMPIASEIVFPLMIEDPQDVKNAIADAECYIMNSDSEGFGLVILEAMLNKTPWISRDIAGASLLREYGNTYTTESQLIDILQNFHTNSSDEFLVLEGAYQCVTQNYLIKNTVDDILVVANEKD